VEAKKRALISVSNKAGIGEFAKKLTELDWEIISTGGTAKVLRAEDIPVIDVAEVTGFPECFGGRLKTLDPHIFGGILPTKSTEDLATMEELELHRIDLVVCNLYPFQDTVAKKVSSELTIEQIDIGGPSMLRAAAKNYKNTMVVCDPTDYPIILDYIEKGKVDDNIRWYLAFKVFEMTAEYDAAIKEYFELKNPHSNQRELLL